MAYNPTDWQNLPNTTTPLNRNNLKKIEDELSALDVATPRTPSGDTKINLLQLGYNDNGWTLNVNAHTGNQDKNFIVGIEEAEIYHNLSKSLHYQGEVPSDWNNAKTFGVYRVSGTNYSNAIHTGNIFGILIVYESLGGTWNPGESNGSWIWQELRETNGNIYRRHAVNSSNSWSTWVPYYNDFPNDISFSVNTDVIPSYANINCVVRGKLAILNIECAVQNLTQWQAYNAITLIGITALKESIGTLIAQAGNKLPITMNIDPNSNVVYFKPHGNTFSGEEYFRGQLIFYIN